MGAEVQVADGSVPSGPLSCAWIRRSLPFSSSVGPRLRGLGEIGEQTLDSIGRKGTLQTRLASIARFRR